MEDRFLLEQELPFKGSLERLLSTGSFIKHWDASHAKQMISDAGKEHGNQYLSTVEIRSFKENFLKDPLHYETW